MFQLNTRLLRVFCVPFSLKNKHANVLLLPLFFLESTGRKWKMSLDRCLIWWDGRPTHYKKRKSSEKELISFLRYIRWVVHHFFPIARRDPKQNCYTTLETIKNSGLFWTLFWQTNSTELGGFFEFFSDFAWVISRFWLGFYGFAWVFFSLLIDSWK